ncbi:hypothetical protein ACLOJK_031579 [Asimina triloba]
MSRIHPTEAAAGCTKRRTTSPPPPSGPTALTVWKKSSMAFQGTDGFSVFDGKGRLVFRVDNYSRKNRCMAGGLVLMDGTGRALLTLRPQMLSMRKQWNAFEGDNSSKLFFSMKRRSMVQSSDEVEVFMMSAGSRKRLNNREPDFTIEGSFGRRHCKIRSGKGEVVAEISRKRINPAILLSDDVFSLVVGPGYDSELMMAFVIVMDRICGKPFTPALCS